jgi:hypothetical protein
LAASDVNCAKIVKRGVSHRPSSSQTSLYSIMVKRGQSGQLGAMAGGVARSGSSFSAPFERLPDGCELLPWRARPTPFRVTVDQIARRFQTPAPVGMPRADPSAQDTAMVRTNHGLRLSSPWVTSMADSANHPNSVSVLAGTGSPPSNSRQTLKLRPDSASSARQ